MQLRIILILLLCLAFSVKIAKSESFTLKLNRNIDNSQNSNASSENSSHEHKSYENSHEIKHNETHLFGHNKDQISSKILLNPHLNPLELPLKPKKVPEKQPGEKHFPDGSENLIDLSQPVPVMKHKNINFTNTKAPFIASNQSFNITAAKPPQIPNSKSMQQNLSALYCEEEVFHHVYITAEQDSRPMTNFWKRSKAGERATTRYLCLLPNGLPITRACLFNANKVQAEWENITNWQNISCLERPRQHIATSDLSELHEELLNGTFRQRGAPGRKVVLQKVNNLFKSPDCQILPADVHYMGQILRETVQDVRDSDLSEDVVDMCSQLMAQDPMVLRLSGTINATNVMLETFERYMDDLVETIVANESCLSASIFGAATQTNWSTSALPQSAIETIDFAGLGVRAHLSENISVFYVNPQCAHITGIAVYDVASTTANSTHNQLFRESRGDFLYRFIRWNENATDVLQEPGVQVATFLPLTLWTSVDTELRALGRTPIIVLKVYATDCLFVEQATYFNRKPTSKVLSISIPGHSGSFHEVLPFILRNKDFDSVSKLTTGAIGTGCGYWNYNTWVSTGVQSPQNALNSPVILCGSLHLTQFSFLVGGSFRQNDPSDTVLITPMHRRLLDIISLLGCSLSLFGLLGIWLTALIFPSWRALATNKVLLNLCSVLTLQLVLFVFVNTNDVTQDLLEDRHIVDCVILGALLQYLILVLFSWMLIVAFLQFQRYVTIIGIERPKHYILKSAIAAWGFPLIPTILVASIDHRSYIPTEYQILNTGAVCYPSGHGLTFGVILPITLIIITNLTIFVYVFYSISHSLKQSTQRSERAMIKQQIRLSVLLYFLLGLSWIFGLFAFMQAGIIFSYLFCLTATLQGFVLFIYFVLLDNSTRDLWQNLCCAASIAKKKAEKRSKETQSMTTSTGLSSREHESESQNHAMKRNESITLTNQA